MKPHYLIFVLFAAILAINAYMWFVQLKAFYFRLLLHLRRIELRPIGDIVIGDPSIRVNRKLIYVHGKDSQIVLYQTDDSLLMINVSGFGLNPILTKGDQIFLSRIGSPPIKSVSKAVAHALAENRWIEAPDIIQNLRQTCAP